MGDDDEVRSVTNAINERGHLTRLVLPQPVTWTRLQQTRHRLDQVKQQLEQASKLVTKFDSITDEPVWDAYIPVGPLAFFKGQLVHTNDITQHFPTSQIEPEQQIKASESETVTDASGPDWRSGQGWTILKSAKQAKQSVTQRTQELETLVKQLEIEIDEQEQQHKAEQRQTGANEDWTFNDNGEVINEEGLPMFDIREELPPEHQPQPHQDPVGSIQQNNDKPQMRYLIKKGGKQVVRPLNAASTPRQQANAPQSPQKKEGLSSSSTFQETGTKLDTKSILDELEKEESLANELALVADEQVDEEQREAETSARPQTQKDSPRIDPSGAATKNSFLPGFASGFLSKKTIRSSSKSTEKQASSPQDNDGESATSCNTTEKAEVIHEPRHHVATPAKSIYRPTPPASAVASRSTSPKPERQVTFAPDVVDNQPKPKRAPIILGPPPSSSSASESEQQHPDASTSTPSPQEQKKTPFVRPIKDTIVERPIKAPSLPKPSKSRLTNLFDVGASKHRGATPVDDTLADRLLAEDRKEEIRDKTSTTTHSAKAAPKVATPIHTISLTNKKSTSSSSLEPGHASLEDLDVEDEESNATDQEEPNPSLTEDNDSDSTNGPLYDDDDDDDSFEEFDMDQAMHEREVALAMHEQRTRLAAGAGTGALGGDLDPDAYLAWNQPNVPVDATVGGPGPASGRSSRFRTGRLEATQMIIPTLLANNIRSSDFQTNQDEDTVSEGEEADDDGLSQQERDNIKKNLEAITNMQPHDVLPSELILKSNIEAAAERQRQVGHDKDGATTRKAPPTVVATQHRKDDYSVTPSDNQSLAEEVNGQAEEKQPSVVGGVVERGSTLPDQAASVAPSPPSNGKPNKMSRFKARQLGLEPSD
ncbi:hypothetical protein OIO90_000416 [Microbotryomycetes sp. JL221]|nr:hypothetical protein OIO90_000416 [Microbotryomycetes sp. JL221]